MALDSIEMKPLSSSNLAAAGYDPFTRTMQVRFTSGKTYLYHGVSQEDYDGLMSAESAGSYFHSSIKSRFNGDPV